MTVEAAVDVKKEHCVESSIFAHRQPCHVLHDAEHNALTISQG